jgi:tetratricopeptide (TPR) repeat protein
MEPFHHSPRSQSSRTFRSACGLLGLIALAQGVAVAVVWQDHLPVVPVVTRGPAGSAVPPVPSPEIRPVAVDPFSDPAVNPDDPHPELAGPAGLPPLMQDPAEPVLARPPVITAAPLDVPIVEEACLQYLDEGIYLRERGDMQGALKELRSALEFFPSHPKLIYQLALTLDGMSQERKAVEHWRKLRQLGTGAGNYYELAVQRLKESGNLPPPEEVVYEGEEGREGRFVVIDVKTERLPGSAQGEVLRIEGRIDRKQPEAADVSKMEIKLHLFDEVNGQRIDRTTALQPVIEWLEQPVDWVEGGERFAFEYRQAPLSPDELLKLGQRKYYGYAVELRYDGSKLQDLVAEPAMLGDLARELPEGQGAPAGGEQMDFSGPGGLPGQPDAVLFPGDRMDR